MSNNETNSLQANFKTSAGSLFNVYGKTPEDFEFNLKCFVALVPDIIAAERAVASGGTASAPQAVAPASDPVAVVKQAFPGAQVVSETPTQGGAPTCRHGQMSWVAPANKPWKGWFCPQPKDATDKCPPQFIKG